MPAFSAIQRSGSAAARRTMPTPVASSPVSPSPSTSDRSGVDQRGAATGDDALLDGRAGRGDGVLDAVLLLLQLHLGVGADLDHADAAGELGQALLQLLAVPVGVGAPRSRPASGRPGPARPRGSPAPSTIVVSSLVTTTRRAVPSTSRPTWSSLRPTSAETTWAPVRTAMSSQHRLAAVAEAGRLDRDGVERAADLVDDQGGQGLALDVLGDDQQRLARLRRPSPAAAAGRRPQRSCPGASRM